VTRAELPRRAQGCDMVEDQGDYGDEDGGHHDDRSGGEGVCSEVIAYGVCLWRSHTYVHL
jgi:hypothetical protein